MSFWDNYIRVIQHISHSFIISDDTGYSDRIFIDDEDRIVECDHSYKINENRGDVYSGSRYKHTRSLTKTDVEKACQAMYKDVIIKKACKEKVIKLLDDIENSPIDNQNITNLFEIKKITSNALSYSSKLSIELGKALSLQSIPFYEFSKFDARGNESKGSTKVKIYLENINIPMTVSVLSSARVFELIGLILYRYYDEKVGSTLKGCVDDYRLYIAEETGDIDDLPPLDSNEGFWKFKFDILALVKVNHPLLDPLKVNNVRECVTINYSLKDYKKESKKLSIPRPPEQMLIIEILTMAIRRKNIMPSDIYVLALDEEGNDVLDHHQTLSEIKNKEFYFLKIEKKSFIMEEKIKSSELLETMLNYYDNYHAKWVSKRNSPLCQVTISPEYIQLKPLLEESKGFQKNKFKISSTHLKTEHIPILSIQKCEIIVKDKQAVGISTLNIIAMKDNNYKKLYELEAKDNIVRQIISKINSKFKADLKDHDNDA